MCIRLVARTSVDRLIEIILLFRDRVLEDKFVVSRFIDGFWSALSCLGQVHYLALVLVKSLVLTTSIEGNISLWIMLYIWIYLMVILLYTACFAFLVQFSIKSWLIW